MTKHHAMKKHNAKVYIFNGNFQLWEKDPAKTIENTYHGITQKGEMAILVFECEGAWDLFLTSRGLFYIARERQDSTGRQYSLTA